MMSGVDVLRALQTPFSYPFYEAVHNLRRTLVQGITHVRDAGGADLGVAEAVRNGLIAGPRMQIAISMLSQTGGHGDGWHVCGAEVPHLQPHPGRPRTVVDGPDEMRRTVRELLRAGADVLKVATSGGVLSARDDPAHPHFRATELDVLVEEAEAAGVAVMAHAQSTEGIKAAVRAGIRSIEHGIFLDDEAIDLMLERGTWLVPTLSAPRAVLEAVAGGAALPEAILAKAVAVQKVHDASVARAAEAGVRIAMGTDTGVGPHGTNLGELGLMAGIGMSPEQVWRAAPPEGAPPPRGAHRFGGPPPRKGGRPPWGAPGCCASTTASAASSPARSPTWWSWTVTRTTWRTWPAGCGRSTGTAGWSPPAAPRSRRACGPGSSAPAPLDRLVVLG